MKKWLLAALFTALPWSLTAAQVTEDDSSIEVMGEGTRVLLQCKNRDVEITGTNHVIEFSDRCRSLSIMGSNNRVVVQEVDSVEITGTNNRVGYRRFVNGVEGRRPAQNISGSGNLVYREVASTSGQPLSRKPATSQPVNPSPKPPTASTSEAIRVSAFGGSSSHDCLQGRNVVIEASNSTVVLRGTCGKVEVTGMGNTVTLEAAQNILVTGTMNKVLWRRGPGNRPPIISNTGLNNQISQLR